ncbi:MAG: Crp/Fnr family transcriptional regulator [Thiogranum sp.]|nr:Crp/Fnr family transcriptional regulator [Thiogranum sp.]
MNSNYGHALNQLQETEARESMRHGRNMFRDDVTQMLGGGHSIRFAPRDVIFREGEAATTAFVLRSGMVKLVSYLVNGRPRIVRLYGPGSLLGISGLVDPVCEHTAIAVDDVEAECIPIRRLLRLRAQNPRLYALIAESWYSDLREADTWITQFSTGSIKARVARLVNHLSSLTGSDHQGGAVSLLTCSEMAAVLGVTPESVSRVLAEFKRNDLLHDVGEGARERYRRNVPALQAIAED